MTSYKINDQDNKKNMNNLYDSSSLQNSQNVHAQNLQNNKQYDVCDVNDASVLNLIGDTPLVQLRSFDTGCCQLFVKLEHLSPSGSMKDRMALHVINAAETAGLIRSGDTLVEATSGNTAMGLALVAAVRGYKLLIVMHSKVSKEKVAQVKAMGAEVVITPFDLKYDHPDYYHNLARRLAEERGAFYINQFANPHNPQAYEETLAPEIWGQMQHNLDAVVCGVGTGGHITGIARFMQRQAPHVKIIAADPEGSIIATYVNTRKIISRGMWLVEGIGEDLIRPLIDFDLISEAITVKDAESFATARALLRNEGIFAGSSSGAAVAAAVRYCRAQQEPKRVVTIIYDGGYRYASKLYSDDWMREHGFDVEM